MRKDIQIDINTGDIVSGHTGKMNAGRFHIVSIKNDGTLYGEIIADGDVESIDVEKNGIAFNTMYYPLDALLKIRIYLPREKSYYNQGYYYTASAKLAGRPQDGIRVCQLPLISETSILCKIDGFSMLLYDNGVFDLSVGDVDRQNANMLLVCCPGNNYRYPVAGVGLVRWINANSSDMDNLAETIKREFSQDGIDVTDALFDFDTMGLSINANVYEN